MKHKASQEIFVTIVFVITLLLLLNPFGLWMPDKLLYIMLGGVLVLFAIYVSFIIREAPQDEREQLHRFISNRAAYLMGSATIVVAIVYQGLTESHIDPWLLITLGVMVVTKVISHIHSQKNR